MSTIKFPEYISGERRMHTCSICGFRGFWTDRWAWYGSLKDEEEGSPIIKTCSDECLSKAKVNL